MKKKYPYSEGDDYYTIDNSDIIWSCWDEVSEGWLYIVCETGSKFA